jgi:competence protein ComGC
MIFGFSILEHWGPCYKKQKGYLLNELFIYLALLSAILILVTAVIPKFDRSINKKDVASVLYMRVCSLRARAWAYDEDMVMFVREEKLRINEETKEYYKVPENWQISMTKDRLGFKGNGNTKYAGSIYLNKEQIITLGVGYGQVRLK